MRILTLVSLRDGSLIRRIQREFPPVVSRIPVEDRWDLDKAVRLFSFKNEVVHSFSAVSYAFDSVHTFLFG